jgi:hypothetical protein
MVLTGIVGTSMVRAGMVRTDIVGTGMVRTGIEELRLTASQKALLRWTSGTVLTASTHVTISQKKRKADGC